MTQHCTITGTMLVPVHYIICTLKIVFFPEITVFVVVKINSFQCQCQCQCVIILSCVITYELYWNSYCVQCDMYQYLIYSTSIAV